MPIYAFEYCRNLSKSEIVEVELGSDAEAKCEAIKCAGEHLIDSAFKGGRPDHCTIQVRNEAGDLLWTIDVAMRAHAQPHGGILKPNLIATEEPAYSIASRQRRHIAASSPGAEMRRVATSNGVS